MSERIENRGGLKVTVVDVEPLPGGEYPYLFNQSVLSAYCYRDRPCEVYLKGECFYSNVDQFSGAARAPGRESPSRSGPPRSGRS